MTSFSSIWWKHSSAGLDLVPHLQHVNHYIAVVSISDLQDVRGCLSGLSSCVIKLQHRGNLRNVRPKQAQIRPRLRSSR